MCRRSSLGSCPPAALVFQPVNQPTKGPVCGGWSGSNQPSLPKDGDARVLLETDQKDPDSQFRLAAWLADRQLKELHPTGYYS